MSEEKIGKSAERMLESVARGILVGGSIGAIAGWFFMDFQRALFLGMLVGCIGGITMKNVRDKKESEKDK